ncbi:C10 family peptidase [Serratia sp. C2(2)]|nr:C10 family peptidase [Serratia sp. C2(2)]
MMKHDLAFETLSILTIGRKTFSPTVIYTRYHHGLELFKIYSLNEDGSGFIICASVKHLPPVIGYSLSHLFFPKAIVKNDDTERFLDEIARTAIDNQSRQVTYDADYAKRGGFKLHGPYPSESTAISPMLKTRWNQSSPYNDKTPGYTGCVATAAAQLMKYHEWPVTGTGIIPAYTVGDTTMPAIDINNFMYQWDKMKDIGKGTPEEDNAVADLMLHIGCAVKMHYMSGGSAAFVQDVGPMLSRHYSYDPDVTYGDLTPKQSETTFSDYEIISIFRHEIENKRPVQIGGKSHSVVCDGMDENQFFHLNFGWGISGYDGYYNLPHNIWCEDIVVDIKPREYLPLSMTPVSSQQILTLGESFFTTVMVKNTTGVDFEGQIVLALADVSGVIIQLLDDNQTVHIPAGTEVPMTFASHLPNIMTCNPRRLYLLANNPSLKYGWKKIPNIFNGNNFFSVNIIRPKTSNKVRLDKSLDTPVAFYRDEMSPVSVILRNIGEPFTGRVTLCFVSPFLYPSRSTTLPM